MSADWLHLGDKCHTKSKKLRDHKKRKQCLSLLSRNIVLALECAIHDCHEHRCETFIKRVDENASKHRMVITLPDILKPIAIAQIWVTFWQLNRLDVSWIVMNLLIKLVFGKPHLRIDQVITRHPLDIQIHIWGVRYLYAVRWFCYQFVYLDFRNLRWFSWRVVYIGCHN